MESDAPKKRAVHLASSFTNVEARFCIIMVIIMGVRMRLGNHPKTPFHADSNELLCISIALKLIEILQDCNRT
jgi:hypothetical protein